ncbi:coiled-coil domain-containing protein [Nocardia carnea]|uniref:Uncharacterized protein n=1 Tax=Nocardia carnea TaxID=37328 RepID=A0ABW7TS18_9NOCA|nr:hypothetical protein [Nocardia carnea]
MSDSDAGSDTDLGPGAGSAAAAPASHGATFPEPVAAVVRRWNPQGMALLDTMTVAGENAEVRLLGPDDANTTLLRTELARFQPRIELSAPSADPAGAAAGAVTVLVLDAGVVIGATELDLVRRLSAAGSRVLLVLNGTHAHLDWQLVRDRSAELLTAAGLDCEIVPVSARLALAARTAADSALLDRSGLASLHARLAALTTDTTTVDTRRSAATAQVVAQTLDRIAQEEALLAAGSEAEMLRAERARLLAERDGGRAVAVSTLRAQLNLARMDLLTQVGHRGRALHAEARTELDRLDRAGRAGFPERLRSAVAALTDTVDRDIAARLTELRARAAAAGPGAPDRAPVHRHDPAPTLGPDPQPRGRGVEDHLMIVVGASAGVGLGRLLVSPLALVPALDVATIPVTLLLGAGAAAWVVRARRQLADRDHLRQWVVDAIANVKAQLEQRAVTALVEAETELSDEMVRSAADRMLAVDRRVAELETALRRATSGQPGRLAACARDRQILEQWAPDSGN